jgi:hypothetical protein
LPFPNNATILWVHQGLIHSLSWSNHLWNTLKTRPEGCFTSFLSQSIQVDNQDWPSQYWIWLLYWVTYLLQRCVFLTVSSFRAS